VVYAGRHIPEKQVPSIVPAIALARQHIAELSATIMGDGPERRTVQEVASAHGIAGMIDLPGFVADASRAIAMRDALCLILPSRREGFGLVIVEAAVTGTPSIVVAGPDTAAAELIEDGVNGFVVPSASAEDLASAILRVHEAGMALRESTASWFQFQAGRLRLSHSLDMVLAAYRHPASGALAQQAVDRAEPKSVYSPTHLGS
jgi:glycosyltransferase involved in cell wall biosynthesis